MDASSIDIKHCKLDDNGRYLKDIDSSLNRCFNTEANIDQTGRAFRNDMFLTLLDKGSIVLVPTETNKDPILNKDFDVESMRVGQVVQWYPKYVRVKVYDERDGQKKEITLPKRVVAIVENPFLQKFPGGLVDIFGLTPSIGS